MTKSQLMNNYFQIEKIFFIVYNLTSEYNRNRYNVSRHNKNRQKIQSYSRDEISEPSRYTSELLNELTDDRKRGQAQRRLWAGFKFSDEQISILIPAQKSGRGKVVNLTTLEKALPNSEKTINVKSSRLRRELRSLNASYNIVKARALYSASNIQR